jgi:hypothetical protein
VHHGQHDRYLDQHTDYRCERRSGLEAKEDDCRRHGQLKKVAGSNERRWPGNTPLDAKPTIYNVRRA